MLRKSSQRSTRQLPAALSRWTSLTSKARSLRRDRQSLHHLVQESLALVKGRHHHALIAAVGAIVVALGKEALHAISRNSRRAQGAAIGGARAHGRKHHRPWPH